MNFSEWGTYSPRRADHKLEESVELVEEGEMPLESYTLAHGEAKLSEAQKKIFQKFLANFNKNPRDADFYNVMAGIIRERSEDSLEAISQRLGEIKGIPLDLVQKFKETKKLYGNLATVQKILEGAIAREKRNNMFGLTDYIMGSALGGSTGVMVGTKLRRLLSMAYVKVGLSVPKSFAVGQALSLTASRTSIWRWPTNVTSISRLSDCAAKEIEDIASKQPAAVR